MPPVFDNGLGLLADTKTLDGDYSLQHRIRKVKAKPFSTSFKKQISYFSDVHPLKIRAAEFLKNLDYYVVDFKLKEFEIAKQILVSNLKKWEGVADSLLKRLVH